MVLGKRSREAVAGNGKLMGNEKEGVCWEGLGMSESFSEGLWPPFIPNADERHLAHPLLREGICQKLPSRMPLSASGDPEVSLSLTT